MLRLFWFAKPQGMEDTFATQILTAVNSPRYIILWVCLLSSWGASAASPEGDWPMFHGGPSLTGVAATSLPERLGLLWTFKKIGRAHV